MCVQNLPTANFRSVSKHVCVSCKVVGLKLEAKEIDGVGMCLVHNLSTPYQYSPPGEQPGNLDPPSQGKPDATAAEGKAQSCYDLGTHTYKLDNL